MERRRLIEVVRVFGWIGATAFGGPAAHVALMRSELVERRRWLDDEAFLDLVGLTALLPGPNSTELAIEIGRRRAGSAGLLAAGVAFIAPAALLVTGLAWAYSRYDTTEAVADLRLGIVPVVVAVVAHAAWKLGRTAVHSPITGAVAVGATAAFLAGVNELLVLAVAAALVAAWTGRHRVRRSAPAFVPWVATATGSSTTTSDVGLLSLLWSFLRIGALLFGSGYVLVAFLRAEFVDRLGVLTNQQLADAVAAGQVTPGPLFTSATFVGYLLHGVLGAAVATVGIFTPAFVLVALLGRFVGPLLARPGVRPVLDGLNAASVGLIAGAAIELADEGLGGPVAVAGCAAALVALALTKVNPTWLLAGGAAIGIARALV